MANTPQNTRDVLSLPITGGMDVSGLEKSGQTWLQNVLPRGGRYEARPGFGTLAQFGTTLNSGTNPTHGYGRPLGANLQVTNSGHVQLQSLHQLSAFTGELEGNALPNLVALSVFDVTTGRRCEHVFRMQSQWVSNLPDTFNPTVRDPQFVQDSAPPVPSFAQLADLLYMCLPNRGVWMYRPVDPVLVDQRLQSVRGMYQGSDDAWIERVQMTDGLFAAAGTVYFTPSDFPLPSCITAFQNRLVYASGRKLFFSDVDRPDNVAGNSFYQLPTELPITALASVKGVILAFTAEETWLYQPSDPTQTGLISGGSVYNLSRSQGCLSPQSLCYMGDVVVFMDSRGIYSNDGSMAIQKLSGPIDAWFSTPDQVQNPFTSFVVKQGGNTLSHEQPRAWIDLQSQLGRCTMAWDAQNQFLYVTFEDFALMLNPGTGWHVLQFETMAIPQQSGVPQVGITKNIVNPILLTHGGNVYMVAGSDDQQYGSVEDSSVYILQLGRGGGLDRSSVSQEDRRRPSQRWEIGTFATNPAYPDMWVCPPIQMPDGFKTLNNTTTEPVYLVPVFADLLPTEVTQPEDMVETLELWLQFDNTLWKPLLIDPLDSELDYLLPTPRLGSADAYDVNVYQTGTPDPGGNEIRINWDGLSAPHTWSEWPSMSLTPRLPQPLIWLLMQRIEPAQTTLSMGWSVTSAQIETRLSASPCNVYLAQESLTYPEQNLGNNGKAQPVDWAVTTGLVGDGKSQLLARGSYTVLRSYGKAAVQQVANWLFGPFGTETSSDYNDFSAQLVAFRNSLWGNNNNPNVIADVGAPRLRLQTTAQAVPVAKIAGGTPKWGDTATPSAGNLLIDDPATDTIATSEGVRGEKFRVMLAGCINANGEGVQIESVKVLVRQTGGLRRSGRRGLT